MKRIHRVLYASDFSSASRRAFDTALGIAKSLNAKLAIVHALAPIVTVRDRFIVATTLDQLDKQARRVGRERAREIGGASQEGRRQGFRALA